MTTTRSLSSQKKGEVSVSWVIRRAIEEYLANHTDDVEPTLPLRRLQKVEKKRNRPNMMAKGG
ncbi:ribbon-helix-helix protein, CopG family [Jhaorihella thermophila]